MIVCHCAVVSDRDVSAAISAGACSLAQVCMSTSAGRQCGGCVPTLKRLLCQHDAPEVPSMSEVAGATA